jgi:hypothetical protein
VASGHSWQVCFGWVAEGAFGSGRKAAEKWQKTKAFLHVSIPVLERELPSSQNKKLVSLGSSQMASKAAAVVAHPLRLLTLPLLPRA